MKSTIPYVVLFCLLVSALSAVPAPCEALAAAPAVKEHSHQEDFGRPGMTVPAALRMIRERLQKGVRGGHGIFGSGCDKRYENINATFTRLSFTRVDVCENKRYESPPESVSFQFSNPSDWQRFRRLGDAMGFADAVNAIGYYTSGSDVADDVPTFAGFREEAKEWRALPVKPALPESVRRFKILAEDAIKNKNFEEAVDYYEQGLRVSALWPDGQFNAALLYAELGIYGQAVIHMKRYVELGPDAPDAPSARDQIVIWQSKLSRPVPVAQDTHDDHGFKGGAVTKPR